MLGLAVAHLRVAGLGAAATSARDDSRRARRDQLSAAASLSRQAAAAPRLRRAFPLIAVAAADGASAAAVGVPRRGDGFRIAARWCAHRRVIPDACRSRSSSLWPGSIGGLAPRQHVARLEQAELLLAESQRAREEQARAAALDERLRIAREVHDVLAHSLAALSISLEVTHALLADERDPDAALAQVERSQQLVTQGIAETGRRSPRSEQRLRRSRSRSLGWWTTTVARPAATRRSRARVSRAAASRGRVCLPPGRARGADERPQTRRRRSRPGKPRIRSFGGQAARPQRRRRAVDQTARRRAAATGSPGCASGHSCSKGA